MDDIFDTLHRDHEFIRARLAELDDESRTVRVNALREAADALLVHTSFEEEAVYPLLSRRTGMERQIDQDYSEHDHAESLVNQLIVMEGEGAQWHATVADLRQSLARHVEDEESVLFPAGRRVIAEDERQALADEYRDHRRRMHLAAE